MEHELDAYSQEVGDNKPTLGKDEVWETTQLAIESAIGDLQRGSTTASVECPEAAGDEAAKSDAAVPPRRASRKKRRPKPPRVIPPIRVYVGTFVHSTVDNPLVILDQWMIGVDAGKVSDAELLRCELSVRSAAADTLTGRCTGDNGKNSEWAQFQYFAYGRDNWRAKKGRYYTD